ncbi:MAG: chemotaxis protein CheX [Sedimentisphaerales bacterium]|nr:chemotaxis protein CheX [Sedimentisphaerales bacterium]
MPDESKGINPKLITAFVSSTRNVLSMMVGVESEIGKPALKTESKPCYDVSGIVGFSGEVAGSVVISFHEEAALSIVEAFCGERIEVDNPDFADAIGELSNMIAGNAKKDFGLEASIGIPSVIIGPEHTLARLSDVPCIAIPCSSEVGNFSVEVNIKQVSKVTV